jgi:hypothetical protein
MDGNLPSACAETLRGIKNKRQAKKIYAIVICGFFIGPEFNSEIKIGS